MVSVLQEEGKINYFGVLDSRLFESSDMRTVTCT
jgi:hypothetical protein